MCGAPIAAFVLLPWLGMERSIFGVAALYGAIGALAMRINVPPHKARRVPLVVSGIALVLSLAGFSIRPDGRDVLHRASPVRTPATARTIVATREGPSETIFLFQTRLAGRSRSITGW